MIRNVSHCVVAAAFLLLPVRLMAGGPPFLCLPVDGVTSENVQACTELLNSKLAARPGRLDDVKLIQRTNQWYLAFYMKNDVRLSDVKAALEASEFSIPRDRLHLFGHVILEIDARPASRQALLSGLEALPHVSVEETKTQEDLLLVTVDMPYPVGKGRRDLESVGWDTFRRNGLNSNQSTKPSTPVTRRQLPSYETIRELVSKHNAGLKDIRWSTRYVCRPHGGVAEPGPAAREVGPNNSTEAALPVGKWNVEFTNGVTEVCDVFNFDGGGHATVDEPQRTSRGTVVVNGGSVVMTFNDDRVERWIPVGKRFVVEHWFPGSRFPTATPILGIAELTP
ncbi:MAG: hypothetical protein EXS05_23945 [Planctomycetaceae bacterium]|nr:hypothetical protein [Planctomycetaceae bacterium]